MRSSPRHVDRATFLRGNSLPVYLKLEGTFQHVKALVLAHVPVQRRPAPRLGNAFHEREVAVRVGSGKLQQNPVAKNVQWLVYQRFGQKSACFDSYYPHAVTRIPRANGLINSQATI